MRCEGAAAGSAERIAEEDCQEEQLSAPFSLDAVRFSPVLSLCLFHIHVCLHASIEIRLRCLRLCLLLERHLQMISALSHHDRLLLLLLLLLRLYSCISIVLRGPLR